RTLADHPDAQPGGDGQPRYPRGHPGGPRLGGGPPQRETPGPRPPGPGGRAGDHRYQGLCPHSAPAADRAGPGRASRLRQRAPAGQARRDPQPGIQHHGQPGRDRHRGPQAARRPAGPVDGRPAGGRGAPRPRAGPHPRLLRVPRRRPRGRPAGRGIAVMAVPRSVPRAASGAVQASWLDNQALNGPAHQLHLDEPLLLDCGRALPEYVVNFETYGTLSAARDNAILVCHSLTSRAHAAGRHAPDDPQPGWWDAAIGPGKMLDTTRYFVICTDALGAGQTTGPASPDPETGRRYGIRFPVITVRDMVRAQHRLVQRLGIDRLHAVIGGCMGGQQALEWSITYPAMVGSAVVITTTPATSAHTIAIFAVMRHLIRA